MKNVLKTRRASDVSLEELLAFERLLSDLFTSIMKVAGKARRGENSSRLCLTTRRSGNST